MWFQIRFSLMFVSQEVVRNEIQVIIVFTLQYNELTAVVI